MNRNNANIIIDLIAALLFLGMIATGYLLRFPLPPGSNKTRILWGLSRHQWGDIHFWISAGLLAVMVLHLVLHWNWIITVIGKRCGSAKTSQPSLIKSGIWTLVVVSVVFGVFAWIADGNVKESVQPCRTVAENCEQSDVGQSLPEVLPSKLENGKVVWNEVYTIFARNCLSCHGPQKQFADFRVDRRDDFFKSTGESALILPGRGADSPLVAIISGARSDIALAEDHKLTESEVSLIKSWIDQGAEWPETPLSK